jgi:hypothetical protein
MGSGLYPSGFLRRGNMFGYSNPMSLKGVFRALTLGGIVVLSGCGSPGLSPLAPNLAKVPQAPGEKATQSSGPVYLALSPRALQRASKPAAAAGVYTRSASGWFSPGREGRLEVHFPRYADAGEVQVKRATFEVEKGSIEGRQEITMQVTSGHSLSDVLVAFSPEGLTFDPPATLTIVLRGEVDPGAIQVYHFHGGAVEKVSATVEEGERTTTIAVKVFSFSTYVLGGEDELPPEGDNP